MAEVPIVYKPGFCMIGTSVILCSANQWTGFYMISASVMKELSACEIKDLVLT